MRKLKALLTALLSVTIVFGATVPTYAASSEVKIAVEATTMDQVSVTVPTTIPIVFHADGTNTLPTNWTIENRSTIAGIHLSQIDLVSEDSQWKVLANSANVKALHVDSKSIKFSVGKPGDLKLILPVEGNESSVGCVTFGDTEISIPSGEVQLLSFQVERGAFTQSEASAKAFNMVLTFNFN